MPPEPTGELVTNWRQVLAWRLQRHHLLEPTPEGAAAVAGRLNGVHAQVMSCAELAIGLRAPSIAPPDIERALVRERSLVKTWAMRGTLHLLPAADLPLWVAALGTRPLRLPPYWLTYHGVTAADVHAVLDAIPRALDGRCLTREALAREAAWLSGRPRLEAVLKGGWGSLLKPVAWRGLLCFGPNEGRNVTFVRPDQWLGRWQAVDTEAALDEILRRYLDAYGPASHADFALWFGTSPRAARGRFERLANELVSVDVEGRHAWLTRAGAEQLGATEPTASVRLVPGFDPYVIGALPHVEHLLPGPFRSRVSRTAGWISPTLLVDGAIAGIWRHERRGSRLRVRIEPFAPLPNDVRVAAEARAEGMGAVLGVPVEVSWEADTHPVAQ